MTLTTHFFINPEILDSMLMQTSRHVNSTSFQVYLEPCRVLLGCTEIKISVLNFVTYFVTFNFQISKNYDETRLSSDILMLASNQFVNKQVE